MQQKSRTNSLFFWNDRHVCIKNTKIIPVVRFNMLLHFKQYLLLQASNIFNRTNCGLLTPTLLLWSDLLRVFGNSAHN